MDVTAFYGILAGLSFTLLGLGTQSAWLLTFARADGESTSN